MFKSLKSGVASAAALVASVTGASAGGLSDQIMEQPVVPDVVEAPAAASVPNWVIPLVVLGVIVAAASSSNSSDDDSDEGSEKVDEGGSGKMEEEPGDLEKELNPKFEVIR